MKNGIPLYILNAGDNEVVRIDLLIEGGRWQQNQRLQALFTNRMLREGTRRYSAAAIAEKLDYYGAWLELSSSSEYAYITLYSLNKYLPETLDIFESIVKEPLFPEKELGVIIDSNIQQISCERLQGGLSGPSHFDKCRIWRYASVRAISAEGRLSFDQPFCLAIVLRPILSFRKLQYLSCGEGQRRRYPSY